MSKTGEEIIILYLPFFETAEILEKATQLVIL